MLVAELNAKHLPEAQFQFGPWSHTFSSQLSYRSLIETRESHRLSPPVAIHIPWRLGQINEDLIRDIHHQSKKINKLHGTRGLKGPIVLGIIVSEGQLSDLHPFPTNRSLSIYQHNNKRHEKRARTIYWTWNVWNDCYVQLYSRRLNKLPWTT